MPQYTTVLGLYKPGGGSTGLIQPDEPVDVDKLNENFDLLDAAVGIRTVSSYPQAPYVNQVVYNSNTDTLDKWNGSAWVSALPGYLTKGTQAAPADITAETQRAESAENNLQNNINNVYGAYDGGRLDGRYALAGGLKMAVGTGVSPTPTLDSGTGVYSTTFNISLSAGNFSQTPTVLLTSQSADPGYLSIGVTAQPTNTTATVILRRRNAFATGYWWAAIGH